MQVKRPEIQYRSAFRDEDILRKDILVYHYTSPEGVEAVLKNASLRFTDYRFLNDKEEYRHLKNVFRSVVEKAEIKDGLLRDILVARFSDDYEHFELFRADKLIDGRHSEFKKVRWFVCCASFAPDSLPMWNYYVKNGNYQGYNIGFHPGLFQNYFPDEGRNVQELYYGAVIYDESEQQTICANFLDGLVKACEEQFENFHPDKKKAFIQTYLTDFFEFKCLFFKHKAFSHEEEFRFILKTADDFDSEKYQSINSNYSIRNGHFVPHYDLSFRKEGVKVITVSPMLNDEISIDGLSIFTKRYGYVASINMSSLPVR